MGFSGFGSGKRRRRREGRLRAVPTPDLLPEEVFVLEEVLRRSRVVGSAALARRFGDASRIARWYVQPEEVES